MPPNPRAKAVKIIVAGLPNVGKTTLVATLARMSLLQTERRSAAEGRETTVAMDYGVLELGEGRAIHLYGLPGQERFAFMMDVLNRGVDGLVYLVAAAAADDGLARKHYEETRRLFGVPTVVGVTKADTLPEQRGIYSRVRERLALPPNQLVLVCDPRDRDSAKTLLVALFNEMVSLGRR